MTRIRFVFLMVLFFSCFGGVAADLVAKDDKLLSSDIVAVTDSDQASDLLGRVEEDELHYTFKKLASESGGLNLPVSVDFSNPNDINWDGVLQVNGTDSGPAPFVLPFLPSIPIENFGVKFRVLNKRF